MNKIVKKAKNKNYDDSNLGWLFYKGYYDGLHTIDANKTLIVEAKTKEAQGPIKKYFESKNKAIIQAATIQGKRLSPQSTYPKDDPKFKTFRLETTYPGLITGTGISHETNKLGECKLGLQFDYTLGLPCVLGSSVKGVLRSMFPENKKEKEESRIEYIKSIWNNELRNSTEGLELTEEDVVELCNVIFDGLDVKETNSKSNTEKKNIYLPIRERDIFFDASVFMIKKDLLGLDYITPHKEVLKNPTPIQFMKIMPSVTFEFAFRLSDTILKRGVKFTGDDKLKLFERILLDVGIGAKTNVGYGQFVSKI